MLSSMVSNIFLNKGDTTNNYIYTCDKIINSDIDIETNNIDNENNIDNDIENNNDNDNYKIKIYNDNYDNNDNNDKNNNENYDKYLNTKPSEISKIKINSKFRNYIETNFKDKCIYSKNCISFKLSKISNIKTICDKLKNFNKNFVYNLQYKMHQKQMLELIDRITLLMTTKFYFFNFDVFNYELYELENDNSNDNSLDKIYFIKIKKIKLSKIFTILFHKEIILEYIHL